MANRETYRIWERFYDDHRGVWQYAYDHEPSFWADLADTALQVCAARYTTRGAVVREIQQRDVGTQDWGAELRSAEAQTEPTREHQRMERLVAHRAQLMENFQEAKAELARLRSSLRIANTEVDVARESERRAWA